MHFGYPLLQYGGLLVVRCELHTPNRPFLKEAFAMKRFALFALLTWFVLPGSRAIGKAPLQTIDLRPHGNHELNEDFAPGDYPGDNFSELERGERKFAGIPFRVEDKLIEVAGRFIPDRPERVSGIQVDKRVQNIYFLHGARWGAYGNQGDGVGHWVADGTPIGYYVVNYADRDSMSIPIVYGVDVRDWWSVWDKSRPCSEGKVVWTGNNPHLRTRPEARYTTTPLRLYMKMWQNPHPDSPVKSIDFVSLKQTATPFCIAVTVENVEASSPTEKESLAVQIEQLRHDVQELGAKLGQQKPVAKVSSGGFIDDFSGNYSQKWSILNPNPRNVSLKSWPGMLTITTEQGGIWKSYRNAKNIFVINNPIPNNGDFVATTRLVGFDPQASYNQAGLICLNDIDNYIKYVWQWDDNQEGRCITSLREWKGGNISAHALRLDHTLDDVWMRIIKHGDRYICAASTDGEHYRITGEEAWPAAPLQKIGLIAKNGVPSAPEVEASFDFFKIEPFDEASAELFTAPEKVEAEASPFR